MLTNAPIKRQYEFLEIPPIKIMLEIFIMETHLVFKVVIFVYIAFFEYSPMRVSTARNP